MLQNLGGAHLLVIVFIVLLIFGAPKLPGLAKSLGQSMRILRKEVRSDADSTDESTTTTAQATAADATVTPVATTAVAAPVVAPAPGQPDVR